MNEMRALKRLLVALTLWGGVVVAIGVSADDGSQRAPTTPTATVERPTSAQRPSTTSPAVRSGVASTPVDPHETLQAAAEMTQRMSAPNASGPMFTGQIQDAQLVHSQNPAFVRALEEHQADIDRMLARSQ